MACTACHLSVLIMSQLYQKDWRGDELNSEWRVDEITTSQIVVNAFSW
jgi:hypothetical protein